MVEKNMQAGIPAAKRYMAGIKDAAAAVGLTVWELRTGALSGKYPMMRIGGPRGRMIFDIDMLNERIGEMMQDNVQCALEDAESYGMMRPIKIHKAGASG